MRGCLAVGAASAKALGAAWGRPVVGIHHMQAHALTPLLTEPTPPRFPFLVLLVSGGHTQLVLASGLDRFEILVDTVDNKLGDVFDKAARILHLPNSAQPNGLMLEQHAALPSLPPFDTAPLPALPRAVTDRNSLIFSLAGILAAMQRVVASLSAGDAPSNAGSVVSNQANIAQLPRADMESSAGPTSASIVKEANNDDPHNTALNSKSTTAGSANVQESTRVRIAHEQPAPQTESGISLSPAIQREVSRIFQTAVVEHVCRKVRDAIVKHGLHLHEGRGGYGQSEVALGGLVVSGGVASNRFLRARLREMLDALHDLPAPVAPSPLSPAATSTSPDNDRTPEARIPLFFPPIELCTDNAAMIAHTAILRIQADPSILHRVEGEGEGYGLEIRPKWSLEDLYDDQ